MAHIDTGNPHIRVPSFAFTSLLAQMQRDDPTLEQYNEEAWEGNIMKSSLDCDTLAPLLKDIKIVLNKVSVVMKPKAYLYQFMNEHDCLVAIESGDADEYRIGTMFLRHLNLGLDFEHNQIALGRNPNANDITMVGRARDPYRTAPPAVVILVVLLWLVWSSWASTAMSSVRRHQMKSRLRSLRIL